MAAHVAGWGARLARGGVLFGALDAGGALVGFAILDPVLDAAFDPRLGEVVALYVDARQRGRGVGAALMQAVEARARGAGVERLYVSATPSGPTVDFYRARGFAPTDTPHPGRLAAEPDDIHMLRHLIAPPGREGAAPALHVEVGDITRLAVDAIVNAAGEALLGGGGVDGAIHRAAGPGLLEACRALPEVAPGVRCPTGEARLTPGFALPARHVIHTVGPVWRGGGHDEDALLAACYRACLRLADAHGLATLAFPALSCGVFGFPAGRAADIAVATLAGHGRASRPGRAPSTRRVGGVTDVALVAFDARMQAVLESALRRHAARTGA